MIKTTYPVLLYSLPSTEWLGVIPGVNWQSTGPSPDATVGAMQQELQQHYRRNGLYPYPNFTKVKMKLFSIKVRPLEYRNGETMWSDQEIKLSLPVVYGTLRDGEQMAIIPDTDQRLRYRSEAQLKTLVTYFAQAKLQNESLQQLNRLALRPAPVYRQFELQVNPDRSPRWSFLSDEQETSLLDRMAEVFPPKRSRQRQRELPAVAWQREEETRQIVDALASHRANILVVGESGVGKTAVLEAALTQWHRQARRAGQEHYTYRMQTRRIVAESRFLGDWQKTADELVGQLSQYGYTLWITDVVEMVMSNPGQPETGIAAYLLPYLQRGHLQMIGEISPRELDFLQFHLPEFVACFQLIRLPEMEEADVMEVARKLDQYFRQQYKVTISRRAQDKAYQLLRQYFPYQRFPGKLVRFFGRALREVQQEKNKQIDFRKVTRIFAQWTGLPKLFLADDIAWDSNRVHRYFAERIIGQPAAVQQLMQIVTIFKAGLQHPEKPIKTLLFAGPTGVGKTLTAKALANFFFGYGQNDTPLIAVDMSELRDALQIDRLIGDERQPGRLIQAVREKPFSVVLLDEIEKADKSVLDTLLRMLDEGILIDRMGRETNFRNTIIIMTSNLGANQREMINAREDDEEHRYLSAIRAAFRPEFFNRIDDIVIFQPLDRASIARIVRLELAALSERSGLADQQIELTYTPAVVDYLVDHGYDAKLGARPLQRSIEREVMTPIARVLVAQPDLRRAVLHIEREGDALQVVVKQK